MSKFPTAQALVRSRCIAAMKREQAKPGSVKDTTMLRKFVEVVSG